MLDNVGLANNQSITIAIQPHHKKSNSCGAFWVPFDSLPEDRLERHRQKKDYIMTLQVLSVLDYIVRDPSRLKRAPTIKQCTKNIKSPQIPI